MFQNPFSFKGRIRRSEYILSVIIGFTIFFILGQIMAQPDLGLIAPIISLFIIAGYWFIFAQSAKRCHDRGNNGFFQFIPFYFLWMFFADSEEGDNKYGLSPKEINSRL